MGSSHSTTTFVLPKGGVNIPTIAVGETYSGSKDFGSVTSEPSDFTIAIWNAYYSNSFTLKTNFGPGQSNNQAFLYLFCKKFDSELKVEVQADSYLIDAAGILEYDITVSNLGAELAANIMTHVGPPKWGKNVFTLTNQPAGSETFRSQDAEEDLFLRLPLLAAGASKTFHVKVKIQGDIDSVFVPNVYVYSHHQIANVGDEIIYDITGAKFYKSAADLNVSNLINLPAVANIGDVVGFDFDLNNFGNMTAIDEYRIGMYLSMDSIFDSADVAVGEIVTAQTAVGTIPMVHGEITVPATLAVGDYYLIVAVDADGDIVEADENNNYLTKVITIQQPTGLVDLDEYFIFIQPNPSSDMIEIITPYPIDKVLIYNVFGQLVLQGESREMSVGHLPSGIYAVLVDSMGALKMVLLQKE